MVKYWGTGWQIEAYRNYLCHRHPGERGDVSLQKAGIPSKVFPHNLCHLFATVFSQAYKDIVKLADVLEHSNIETNHVYLVVFGRKHV